MNETSRPSQDRPEPLIRLANVSMDFGGQRVLQDLNLDIAPTTTVAVIGESGCGKTVFLKLIIGLLRPTLGEVLFAGHNLLQLSEAELVRERLRFGFLFQG